MENSVGIRQLKQNASAVITRVKKGEQLVVTERGIPVARIVPAHPRTWEDLIEAGEVIAPTQELSGLFDGILGKEPSHTLSTALQSMRDDS